MLLDGPAHTPEKVTIPADGHSLSGYFYHPGGDAPAPCIVDNHGSQLPNGTADLSHPQTAAFFRTLGCAYLFPHRAGYGDTDGVALAEEVPAPRGTAEHDQQMSARLKSENRDVLATLDWLSGREDIDTHRIAVMGSSLGGIHTLLALAADQRWKCGLDFSGGASQWKDHPIIRSMLIEAVGALRQPVFLIQPENDFNTAPTRELAAILDAAGKPHAAAIFPPWGVAGAEAHRFCAAGQQIWGPAVKAFLEENFL